LKLNLFPFMVTSHQVEVLDARGARIGTGTHSAIDVAVAVGSGSGSLLGGGLGMTTGGGGWQWLGGSGWVAVAVWQWFLNEANRSRIERVWVLSGSGCIMAVWLAVAGGGSVAGSGYISSAMTICNAPNPSD
jgi:hypothetical protein